MSAKVTTKDNGYDAMMKRLQDAAKKKGVLTVGIHEEEGAASHGDASVIDIAAMHEFGLGVPARSFIGAWADERADESKRDLRKLGDALTNGKVPDAMTGLAQLGEKYVGEVQARIAAGIPPENAPSTVAKKGSSTPLIDTGVLRSSIVAKVKTGG